jgi:hypothetical protein
MPQHTVRLVGIGGGRFREDGVVFSLRADYKIGINFLTNLYTCLWLKGFSSTSSKAMYMMNDIHVSRKSAIAKLSNQLQVLMISCGRPQLRLQLHDIMHGKLRVESADRFSFALPL